MSKIFIVIVIIIVIAGGVFCWQKDNIGNLFFRESPKACTQEAKLCLDGSSVGRTGPNCEFAACSEATDASDWQTYRNEDIGFEFKYPKEWKIDQTRTTPNEIVFDIGVAESREAIRFVPDAGMTIEQRKTQIIPNSNVITNQFETTVDGERTLIVETSEFGTTYIIFLHSNIMYVVTTGGKFIEKGILSTFRFID